MLQIHHAEYIKSVVSPSGLPQSIPEIAILGRSNVGKSSFINFITSRKSLVKTSGTPGKTKTINFFRINQSFFLVDLPGLGYAKLGKKESAELEKRILMYLKNSTQLKGVMYLIDFSLAGTELDRKALKLLDQLEIPHLVVCTKADKLTRGRWAPQLSLIRSKFELPVEPLLVSSLKKEGANTILEQIEQILADPEEI